MKRSGARRRGAPCDAPGIPIRKGGLTSASPTGDLVEGLAAEVIGGSGWQ